MVDNVRELCDADFPAAVREGVALVDFHGAYCPPCRLLDPVIEQVAGAYAGRVLVARVNVDDNFAAAVDNSVEDVPTIVLFKDGEEMNRLFGVQTPETLGAELDKLLN